MTPNFLGPFWIQLNYTGYTPHTMTIPVKNWNAGAVAGTFDVWAGGTISALTMIQGLVDKLKPLFNADISFNNFLIYSQPVPELTPEPVASGSFSGQIGTSGSSSWAAGVERIFLARTTGFALCKLDLLDCESSNDFNPVLSPGTDDQALIDYWFADTNGFAGRDNNQPNSFLKITCNLNQKLRKELRLD